MYSLSMIATKKYVSCICSDEVGVVIGRYHEYSNNLTDSRSNGVIVTVPHRSDPS